MALIEAPTTAIIPVERGNMPSFSPAHECPPDHLAIHREDTPLFALARSITLTILTVLAVAGAVDRFVTAEPGASLGQTDGWARSSSSGTGQSIGSLDLPEQFAAPRLGQRLAPTRDPGDTRRLESVLPGMDSIVSRPSRSVSFATLGIGSQPAHGFAHDGLLLRAGSLSSFSTSVPPPHQQG